MKHYFVILTLLIAGCNNQPNTLNPHINNDLFTSYEQDAIKKGDANLTSVKETPFVKHVFGDTLKTFQWKLDVEGSPSSYLKGAISTAFKSTVKNIWGKLEKIGFSGYDITTIADNTITPFNASVFYPAPLSAAVITPKEDLHNNLIQLLVHNIEDLKEERNDFSKIVIPSKKLGYTRALLGLTFNNRLFTATSKTPGEFIFMLASDESLDYGLSASQVNQPALFSKDRPSDFEPVTEAQIAEWNALITDTLKEDPFFGQYFGGVTALSNSSSTPLSSAARHGKKGLDTSLLTLNGLQGNQAQTNLPLYVELKGFLDDKHSPHTLQGAISYKYHNATIGLIQTHATTMDFLGLNKTHQETAVAGAYAFNSLFIEAQLASITVKDRGETNLSGLRSQLTVGYDFHHFSPFVQYIHRNITNGSDHSMYSGVEINLAEVRTESYSLTGQLLFRAGHNSIKGLVGSIEWKTSLELNSGVSFVTGLNLDESFESVRVQVSLTQ